MAAIVAILELIEKASKLAFDHESQAELDEVQRFSKEVRAVASMFGAQYLVAPPDISWHFSTGTAPPQEINLHMSRGRWQMLTRDGSIRTATNTWLDYNWEIRGRTGDIVAWKLNN
jgi:hypothetical protein